MQNRKKPWMSMLVCALLIVAVNSAPLARAAEKKDDRETDPLVLTKLEWFQDLKFDHAEISRTSLQEKGKQYNCY